jgi:ankyrin repeat protein
LFKKLAQLADLAEVAMSISKENKLVSAVIDDNVNEVKNILRSKINWSNATMRADNLTLFYPILDGNLAIIEELLRAGIPVNAKDPKNNTALIYAIKRNQKDVVRSLISHGAKVNIRCGDKGMTPLITAINHTKDQEMIDIIIEAGAKITTRESHGFPPLAFAAVSNLKQVVQHFLNNGVDVNTRVGPRNSTTLIDLVIDNEEEDRNLVNMIDFLLCSGANPEIRDDDNKSAIDYAKEQNNKKILHLLNSWVN